MSDTPRGAEEVLEFWFGPLDDHGLSDEAHRSRWFATDESFDAEVRDRFGALHAECARGEHDDWLQTPRGRLALIIVFDQLSRNIYRDTPEMYAQDLKALAVAKEALASGDEAALATQERFFLYMPLMHAEDLQAQDQCVSLFEKAQAELPPAAAPKFDPKWAVMHRDIVARFGRFPHRNHLLDRESTDDERAFLDEPSF